MIMQPHRMFPTPLRRLVPALILAGGIALAAAFALVGGASLRDAVSLVALALAGAGVAVGLVILFPLLGHATWHSYREIIDASAWPPQEPMGMP